MTRETITIEYDVTSFGYPWVATFASYDGPESPIGTGATPADALDMLLDQVALQPPKVFYPAFSTASAVMELTEQQKAELRKASGIDDLTRGLKPEDKP